MDAVSPRRAQTQAKLMRAALDVFAERGVLGGSVELICERAGFSRGAFYSNFDSRDDLCVALYRAYAQENLDATRAALAHARVSPLEVPLHLESVVDLAVDMFVATLPKDAIWVLAHHELRLHAARTPALRSTYRRVLQEVQVNVEEMLVATLKALGTELRMPVRDAVESLHVISQTAMVNAIIDDEDLVDAAASALKQMMRLLVTVPNTTA